MTSPIAMRTTTSVPEWLRVAHSSPHILSVIRILSEREHTRADARNASRHRSHPSKVHRLSHSLSLLSTKSDYISHYSCSVGTDPNNQTFNRYSDIAPYDRTRVVISSRGVQKGDSAATEGRYLNANWVRELAGKKWWIATQAPLPNTAHAFLSAILQPVTLPTTGSGSDAYHLSSKKISRIRTVVQLTQNFESGMRKAHVYFPPLEGQSWVIQPEQGCSASSLKVTLVRSETIEDAQCVQSTVSIEALPPGQSEPAIFRHMLYGSWPDHGVPSPDDRISLLKFIRLVDDVNHDLSSQPQGADLDPDPPIMVNCSAGVGRTGAFIALSSLLRSHGFLSPAAAPPEETQPTSSPLGPLPEEIRNDLIAQEIDMLREQRPGMIQKDDQVVFVYDMIMAAFAGAEQSG